MAKLKTGVGTTWGKLTIIRRLGLDKSKHRFVMCRCECGNIVTVRSSALLVGDNKTCGLCTSNKYKAKGDITIGFCVNGAKFIIDTDDLKRISKHQWCAHKGYFTTNINGQRKYLHKLIMNSDQNQLVDHINGKKYDCRKNNLRFATFQQNIWNSKKTTAFATSQYIGVAYVSKLNKYRSRITHNKIEVPLGCYNDEIQAAQARNIAGRLLRGEFHRDNDVPEADFLFKQKIEAHCRAKVDYIAARS